MKILATEALALAIDFLVVHGMPADHARVVAEHLIYATRAGHAFAGLPRLQSIAERVRSTGIGGEIRTVKQSEVSDLIDGANVNGYVTSLIGIDRAIEIARKRGVGVVGINNSWFSGMLRYYVERAANSGFVAIHAANSTARVAPFGGVDRILGTNPFAFACPADDTPLVIDFATPALMWGDVLYHQSMNKPLPAGCAVDASGNPTTDPASALAGAILGWGGARGYSVSMIVQALGILAGSDSVIGDAGKWGYLFIVIDPKLFMPLDEFKKRISALRSAVESSRPVPDGPQVRAPGSGTQSRLDESQNSPWIEVDEEILSHLS